MKRKRTVAPIPVSTAILFVAVGLLLGSIFIFGMHYWSAPLEREEAIEVEATIDSYLERKTIRGNSKGIRISFSDYEQQFIDTSCVTDDLRNDLKQLTKGEKLILLIHPNSATIWEIRTAEKTILSFAYTQNNLRKNNIGFGILGTFMYFGAAIGLGSLLMRWIQVKRKAQRG